jgi:hypothetical protein
VEDAWFSKNPAEDCEAPLIVPLIVNVADSPASSEFNILQIVCGGVEAQLAPVEVTDDKSAGSSSNT